MTDQGLQMNKQTSGSLALVLSALGAVLSVALTIYYVIDGNELGMILGPIAAAALTLGTVIELRKL